MLARKPFISSLVTQYLLVNRLIIRDGENDVVYLVLGILTSILNMYFRTY